MKYKITYILQDNTEDILIIEENDVETLRQIAQDEYKRRNAKDAWSEHI